MKYVRRCGCRNVTEITDGQCITAAVCGNTDKDRKVSSTYESKEDDFGQKNRYRLFLSYRKLCFHTIINAPRGCALGARVDGCRGNRASARECAKAHSFLYYSSGAIRRRTHCPNFIAADCFSAYCSVTSLHTGKISSKSSRTFCTASHRCRKTPFSKWKYKLL